MDNIWPRTTPDKPFQREELEAIGRALALRVIDGSMPPDDAYVWARSLAHTADHLIETSESVFINAPRLSA